MPVTVEVQHALRPLPLSHKDPPSPHYCLQVFDVQLEMWIGC